MAAFSIRPFSVRGCLAIAGLSAGLLTLAETSAPAQGPLCFGEPATIEAEPGEVTLGTDGDDVIVGTAGADDIRGGGGDDLICGLGGADVIRGNAGHDQIKAGRGNDRVYGNGGNDSIDLGKGDDFAKGGAGADEIRGKKGRDDIYGNKGVDDLIGGSSADLLEGGSKADRLSGNSGNDVLDGGKGRDDCAGGPGTDLFISCSPTLRDGVEPFDGGLEPGWRWDSGSPARRSFTAVPGALRLRASPNGIPNVLVRDPVADDYVLETRVRFRPKANWQGAGLTVLGRGDNGISLIRAYCDTGDCVGDGVYLDRWHNDNVKTRKVEVPAGTNTLLLRLQHQAGTYTGWYSIDGERWVRVGQWTRDMGTTEVGIHTGGAQRNPVAAADFYHYSEQALD